MHSAFIQYILLVLAILALVMIANKLRVAYPIVLVLGGLALSFTSEFSNITIQRNEHLKNLFAKLQSDLRSLNCEFQETNGNSLAEYERIYLELLERQRRLLDEMNRSNEFDEELIRKYLSLIDLEEFEIREKRVN